MTNSVLPEKQPLKQM